MVFLTLTRKMGNSSIFCVEIWILEKQKFAKFHPKTKLKKFPPKRIIKLRLVDANMWKI
jgi:hypothetical protein